MKRFLPLLCAVALLSGAASAALGSESIVKPNVVDGGRAFAPFETVYNFRILNPAADDTSGIHALYPCYPTGDDTTYAFSAAEKAAFATEAVKAPGGRGLTVTVCDIDGANNNDIKASAITITGTNVLGATITATFTPTDNTAGTVAAASSTAFWTISTIKIVKMDGAGARASVGFSDYFGLPYTSPENPVIQCSKAGVKETTAPTVTFSGTDIELNTIDFNSEPDGSADFSVHLLWPCYQSVSANTRW